MFYILKRNLPENDKQILGILDDRETLRRTADKLLNQNIKETKDLSRIRIEASKWLNIRNLK